jgi:hypothetical protein
MPATSFHQYLRSRVKSDGFKHAQVSSARESRSGLYLARLWVKHGEIDFVHTWSLSEEQFYIPSEEWKMMYEEIKLQMLFG